MQLLYTFTKVWFGDVCKLFTESIAPPFSSATLPINDTEEFSMKTMLELYKYAAPPTLVTVLCINVTIELPLYVLLQITKFSAPPTNNALLLLYIKVD